MTVILYNPDGTEFTRYYNISRVDWDEKRKEFTLYRGFNGATLYITPPGKIELFCSGKEEL